MSKLRENAGGKLFLSGDGYSDTCPAQNADFAFAKGVLYNYCLKASVQYYDSFKDIIRRKLHYLTRKVGYVKHQVITVRYKSGKVCYV